MELAQISNIVEAHLDEKGCVNWKAVKIDSKKIREGKKRSMSSCRSKIAKLKAFHFLQQNNSVTDQFLTDLSQNLSDAFQFQNLLIQKPLDDPNYFPDNFLSDSDQDPCDDIYDQEISSALKIPANSSLQEEENYLASISLPDPNEAKTTTEKLRSKRKKIRWKPGEKKALEDAAISSKDENGRISWKPVKQKMGNERTKRAYRSKFEQLSNQQRQPNNVVNIINVSDISMPDNIGTPFQASEELSNQKEVTQKKIRWTVQRTNALKEAVEANMDEKGNVKWNNVLVKIKKIMPITTKRACKARYQYILKNRGKAKIWTDEQIEALKSTVQIWKHLDLQGERLWNKVAEDMGQIRPKVTARACHQKYNESIRQNSAPKRIRKQSTARWTKGEILALMDSVNKWKSQKLHGDALWNKVFEDMKTIRDKITPNCCRQKYDRIKRTSK